MSLSNNNPELLDIARGSFHGVEASIDMNINEDASDRDWSWVSYGLLASTSPVSSYVTEGSLPFVSLPAQYVADQHMLTASASPSTSASVSHRTRLPGLFSRTAFRNVMPSRVAPYPVSMLKRTSHRSPDDGWAPFDPFVDSQSDWESIENASAIPMTPMRPVRIMGASTISMTPMHPIPAGSFPQGSTRAVCESMMTGTSYPTAAAGPPYIDFHSNHAFRDVPAPPVPEPPSTSRAMLAPCMECRWDGGCGIGLDDLSMGGVERHLRQFHINGEWHRRVKGRCLWHEGGKLCGRPMLQGSYGKHISSTHFRAMAKFCDFCGGEYARSDVLARHQMDHCPSNPARL
ncbi:hypothetical protein SCP_1500540 [Sparassis crispa]|uniref:C2H2-type domain-containing protein n=1 Tax=Sparassis crispa TaxID=139825 RepID=A0A401H3R5_9APHY|nr:hypothetical protein SCP_1500540 [Sparassis crispa]GBE89052.1 hypothetical protein SCP_1500540 [Sparassis crispa]